MGTNNQTPEKGAHEAALKNSFVDSAKASKQLFIEEQQNILRNIWVPVCHESELPEPYDFRTSSIGNENIIVCRAPDGKINALLNVCPHRGMLIERRPRGSFLEGQASGNPKRITCMFHAWQFDMRGNCVYVAREKEGYQDRFCKDEAGLRRLRCRVHFGGFVWVNMNDQPVATLEEWVGDAFSSLEGQINSTPLEVVHYRKEFIDTALKTELLKASGNMGSHSKHSLFNFGHFMSEDSQPGADTSQNKHSFPTPDAMQSIRVNLFPGFSFHLDGPTLNVATVTPVDENRLMVEHKSLAPQGESETERNTRSRFYNANFGPFKAMEHDRPKAEVQNDEGKQAVADHLLQEWSRWMDQHPDGESRLSELATRRRRNAILDKDEDLVGPKVIVIGASHAGIALADRLRKNGFAGKVAIFDRQVGGPMERPPLSKGFLLGGGETVESKSLLRQKKWYKTNKVRLNTQTSVQAIDTKNKTVTVNNGDIVSYDTLVIASGAIPRELPDTVGMGNSFTLRQPSDANAIRQAANNADAVIIIGGGYIGLEVAASLRKKGLDVTVIEAAGRILARVASQPLADHLAQLHRDNGVTVLTGIGVDKINKEDGSFDSVTLSNGEKIKADMLITGIGVFPDSKLAAEAGIETQRDDGGPILVNNMMQTSDENVFAIGDVAIRRDQAIAVESVHNAQETASIAAAAITNTVPPTIQTPWFWSDQYDTKLQSVGIVPVQDEEVYQVVRPSKREHGKSFWSYKGAELVAVEVVNDPATYMEARQCLDTKRSPDPSQISSLSYSPIDSGGGRSQ